MIETILSSFARWLDMIVSFFTPSATIPAASVPVLRGRWETILDMGAR